MKQIKVAEISASDKYRIEQSILKTKKNIDNLISPITAIIGRFDTGILLDVLTGGNNTRNEIERTALNDIENLSSIIMKDEFKNKLKTALSDFDNISKGMIEAASGIEDIIPIRSWVVEDGAVLVNDYGNLIDSAVSIYITNPKGIELYNRMQEMTKELNSLNELSKKYQITPVNIHRGFVSINPDGYTSNVSYSVNGELIASYVKEVFGNE